MNYPTPTDNPGCQCGADGLKSFWCAFGHMTECHFPYSCVDAACGHLHKYDYTAEAIANLEARARQRSAAGELSPYTFDEAGNVIIAGPEPEARLIYCMITITDADGTDAGGMYVQATVEIDDPPMAEVVIPHKHQHTPYAITCYVTNFPNAMPIPNIAMMLRECSHQVFAAFQITGGEI